MSLVKKHPKNHPAFGTLFSELWDAGRFFDNEFFQKDWLPAINVKSNDDHYEVEVAVPGWDKEDFNISLEHGVLTISSEQKNESKKEEDNYTRKEFSYSSFRRSFTLPEDAHEESIKAKYENGILRLTIERLAKKNEKSAREIEIT